MTWGSWEELLLGGAVVRHGSHDWTVVAAELRSRTSFPPNFTPEACKAKYEELQQRYSGSSMTWFEELKKKRIEELKRSLELSEDSIGCLESKIESLKAAKNETIDGCHAEDGSAGPELNVPPQKLVRVDSFPKEASKDGLSAGSFTHETRANNWSSKCQVPAVSSEDMETNKLDVSRSAEREKVSDVDKSEHTTDEGKGVGVKKRRATRKRKDCDVLVSVDASQCKESYTSNCDEVAKSPGIGEENTNLEKDGIKDLMEILDSVLEAKGASAFIHKHDSQKRARYRNLIRQHMDFQIIRARVSSQKIKSARELFRDLMLLATNALIFYSKCTRQHKTARLLKDIVAEKLRENSNGFGSSVTHANVSTALPVREHPKMVRRVRPSDREIVARAAAGGCNNGAKKPGEVDSSPSVESLPIKKASGRPRKVGRGTACEKATTPATGKKRGRAT